MKEDHLVKEDQLNPEETANLVSRLTFWWSQEIFSKGYNRPLEAEDVYPCHTLLQSRTLTANLEKNWNEQLKSPKPSLLKALVKTHTHRILIILILAFFEGVMLVTPPFFIGRVSSYFETDTRGKEKEVLIYAGVLFAINLVNILLKAAVFWAIVNFGAAMRIGASCMVYRKACRISYAALGKTSVGHIVNLVTNDSERLNEGLCPAHSLLNIPITLAVGFGMSYYTIGLYGTLAGFGAILIFVPMQIQLGKMVKTCRNKAAPMTDKRIKLIREVISSMKVIKMYNWESTFMNIIHKIREVEARYIGLYVCIRLTTAAVANTVSIPGLIAMLLTKYYCNEDINSEQVYFFLSISELLRNSAIKSIGATFTFIPVVVHAVGRMQKFLLIDEQDVILNNKCIGSSENETKGSDDGNVVLELSNICSTWGEDEFKLTNINMSVKRGDVVGILGPVGGGKSSIIMSIIKEMEVTEGTMNCSGAISYSSQLPWIFSGTVQENVLFNRPLDKTRLNRVIDACYLFKDLEVLPNGLDTIVGERGVQLSGGQRARVSLARAVYGTEDIVLLDDPLSAVDTKCAHHLFNRLIKGYLSDRTVVLVTHNTEFLPALDYIYLVNGGAVEESGTWQELADKEVLKKRVEEESEEMKKRTMSENEVKDDKQKTKQEKVEESRQTGSIDKKLYFQFWALGLGPLALPCIMLIISGARILAFFQENYSLKWVRDITNNTTFYTYVGLAIGTYFLFYFMYYFVVFISIRATRKLHNTAVESVLKSPMRYFDTTPIGILINRFSKDTYYVDERLPATFIDFLFSFVSFCVSLILMCITNYYFLVVLLPLMGLIGWIVRFYLKTSIEIRRIEAINRSPVMSHISTTFNGMSIIRASKQVDIYEERQYALRDTHTSASQIFKVTARWLSCRLDFIVVILGTVATVSCVLLKQNLGPQLAGLAIVYIQNRLGAFQWCIRQGAECENLMTAVERIFSLAKLPPEEDRTQSYNRRDTDVIDNNTVKQGVVEFQDVSLRYDRSLPFVLHDITFRTKAHEKIGIVGRTGAGKSSILQALYRMCEVQGTILIDGCDTSKMSLYELRSSLSVIPQESLLFSGTLRQNLDPHDTFSDSQLWEALEQVKLKVYVSGQKEGLLMSVEEMGGNMSVGQRQLLCLARALLKPAKVLVIDEATANVDEDTDAAIQDTIKKSFEDRTVLTIAHRLNTIIDSDRIMVIDGGKVVEFDTPAHLLADTSSSFYTLVHAKHGSAE